jgi:signal transduction histidine kinase
VDPLLDEAPCGFLVVRDDGHVAASNKTFAEMLETTPGRLLGAHVDELLASPSRIFYQTHVFPTLRLQGTVHEVYLALVNRRGDEIPVLLNARRRKEGAETMSDWVVVPMRQRNLVENEILKARRDAEAAARAKEEFFAQASHELRNPLGVIRNWAALLSSRPPDAAMLRKALDAIERNAVMQAKLVDDMLDHARAASGKLHIEPAPLNARDVVEAVVDSVAPAAKAKSITLERAYDAAEAPVLGDFDRLQQVFWNIASNAVKFTDAGGRVRTALRRVDDWIEVAVSDTGKGISPQFLPLVFDPFRQEGEGKRSEGGLGLGMLIAREIVELHGGSIAATSAGVGHGSTFTVRLPAREG